MSRSATFEAIVAGFKLLLRDVLCPLFGLWLVLQLGLGRFDSLAIPVIATLASALIGLPIWARSDEKNRDGRRKRKRVTIDWGGGRNGGGDDDSDQP